MDFKRKDVNLFLATLINVPFKIMRFWRVL